MWRWLAALAAVLVALWAAGWDDGNSGDSGRVLKRWWQRQRQRRRGPSPLEWVPAAQSLMAAQQRTPPSPQDVILVDDVISLGPTCLAAWHLRRGGWRTWSYPFDWTLFDDRDTHLSTVAALLSTDCQGLIDPTKLKRESFTSWDGVPVPSVVHREHRLRWLHSDPLSDGSKVMRRVDRLARLLRNATSRRQIVFTLAWNLGEHPAPAQLVAQVVELDRVLGTFPAIAGRWCVLAVFVAKDSDPAYVAVKQALETSSASARLRVEHVLPPLTAHHMPFGTTPWGSDLHWDLFMQRFRRSATKGTEEDVETCLHRHARPQGIARLGFGLCLKPRLPAGTDMDSLFRTLDADRSLFLDGKEFSQLAVAVAVDAGNDSGNSIQAAPTS